MTQLEGYLQALFEADWRPGLTLANLKRQLAYALEDYSLASQATFAGVTLYLHPRDLALLTAEYPYLAAQLSAYLHEVSPLFSPTFQLDLQANPYNPRRMIRCQWHRPVGAFGTPTTTAHLDSVSESNAPGLVAQLWRDGQTLCQLAGQPFSIGRRAENDLVLESPQVSRQHCQLRLRHGQYWLFDLQSKHGCYLNQQRVHQAALQSGDVITLGNVSLLYWQAERMALSSETRPQVF